MEDCGCKVGMFDIGIEFCPMHSAAPELLSEHEGWAFAFGEAFVELLQGDDSAVKELAKSMQIEMVDGSPRLKSAAIAKATQE